MGEKIIWQKRLTKRENLACVLKSASVPLFGFFALGLILSLTGAVEWSVCYLFTGITVISLIITVAAVLVQKPAEYTATTARIICKYQSATFQAFYSQIESVKFSRYLLSKRRGKIKFKMKRGMSINYRFYTVDNVEAVYNLIVAAMESGDGVISNKM